MINTVLTRAVYTTNAIDASIEAFTNICTASATHEPDQSILTVEAREPHTTEELLNYILAASARELLA